MVLHGNNLTFDTGIKSDGLGYSTRDLPLKFVEFQPLELAHREPFLLA